jgi:hypothetical protein
VTSVLARPAGPAPGWTTAWSNALADLELDVAQAEEVLRVGRAQGPAGPAWVPPTNLGLLPAPLVERAQALLSRQLRVAVSLAEAAEHSRRQLRAVEQLRATPETCPVYLDTAG